MTFSILVRDQKNGDLGGAAVTGSLAVGAWVLHTKAGVGIIASQGYSPNPLWPEKIFQRLTSNISPNEVLENLVTEDPGSDYRQLSIINSDGESACWTGKLNKNSKGHISDKNIVVAGNWLANDTVLETLIETYLCTAGNLPDRLLASLDAAVRDGSDSRGSISAAIKVISLNQPPLDLRVDYGTSPVEKLKSLYEKTKDKEYVDFLSRLPTTINPNSF